MKKILVISDVHGDLEVLKNILKKEKDVDLRVFAGDLQSKDFAILKKFDYVVTGNSDYTNKFPIVKLFEFDNINFMLVHGHYFGSWFKKIDFSKLFNEAKAKKVAVIIHGHDHIKASESRENILRFNPGSTTFPRDDNKRTYGLIFTSNGKVIKTEYKIIKD